MENQLFATINIAADLKNIVITLVAADLGKGPSAFHLMEQEKAHAAFFQGLVSSLYSCVIWQ